MSRGQELQERDLEQEIRTLVSESLNMCLFEPADDVTISNAIVRISNGMINLQTKGLIKSYKTAIQLNGTKIVGDVTYTPINTVFSVVVRFSSNDDNFDRAMQGV